MNVSLSEVPGFRIGHWTDLDAGTGCTVVLCPEGAVAGVDVRGGAPGTREIALLEPTCTVEQVHAVLLSGGSAYGLDAAGGVMRWLEERGHGFDMGVARVPIVPAAILFDLSLGRADVRPDAAAGYAACEAATDGPVAEGSVGAGTGATVGKALGFAQATKSGIGAAVRRIGKDIVVAALVAVNAFGDVVDPASGAIVAGARQPGGNAFVGSQQVLESMAAQAWRGGNTTLGAVITNAALTKVQATKVAQMAHDGLARTIRPIHTPHDGDTIFALSRGDVQADVGLIGAVAADVVAEAVLAAVRAASGLHGMPAMRDLAAG
jgi:L-aminopeptidase/D-esterase-like protein